METCFYSLNIMPFNLSPKKKPFQSLLSLILSPCLLGGVNNTEEGGYGVMVSKITNPVFFPHYMAF